MEMKEKEPELVNFIVTARKYKTTLTEKYKHRKVWHKPQTGDVLSHLSGTVKQLLVNEGQQVEVGDLLLIFEAMKMYNRVTAPVAGTVVKVAVKEGDKIQKDSLMVHIEPK